MRLLSRRHSDFGESAARHKSAAFASSDSRSARREYLSLRKPYSHLARGRTRRRADEPRRSLAMSAAQLPALLADNPRLDRWVGFPEPGRVAVSTGRVEIGQGVLTAMLQIAAEELDVAPERIDLETGDTELTPNEGYTAGSQSIQFGGVALSVTDGAILHRGEATGQDYWSLAAAIDLKRDATGQVTVKPSAAHRVV